MLGLMLMMKGDEAPHQPVAEQVAAEKREPDAQRLSQEVRPHGAVRYAEVVNEDAHVNMRQKK